MDCKEEAGQLIGDGFTGHHFRSWRLCMQRHPHSSEACQARDLEEIMNGWMGSPDNTVP